MSSPKITVTLLRRLGKKLKVSEAETTQRFTGSLNTQWQGITHVMTMRTGHPTDATEKFPPDLFHPVIAQMGDRRWRIQGIESIDGAGYVQEWMIDYA